MTNLILIILLSIVRAFGGGGIAEAKVADAVEEALSGKVRSVEVVISANPVTFVAKGKIRRIVFTLDEFKVKPITLDEMVISIEGLKLNSSEVVLGKPARIREIGPVTWTITLGIDQLTLAIRDKAPAIEAPFFSALKKDLEFTGRYRLSKYVSIPFKARGRLKIQDGKRVVFRLNHFEVVGFGVPARLRYIVEDAVNPLIDVEKLMEGKREEVAAYEFALNRELDPRIESIEITKKKLIGKGTI